MFKNIISVNYFRNSNVAERLRRRSREHKVPSSIPRFEVTS